MSYVYNFMFTTKNAEDLHNVLRKCENHLAVRHVKTLPITDGVYAVYGETVAVSCHTLCDLLGDSALPTSGNQLFYILDNESYVCMYNGSDVPTAITVYNHCRSIAFTTYGESLDETVRTLIKNWLKLKR